MITLTNPAQVSAVLGGNTLVNYEIVALTLAHFDFGANTRSITGTLRLRSTSSTAMEHITGDLTLRQQPTAEAIIRFRDGVLFTRRIALSSPQSDALLAILADTQEAIENGLISLGLLAGTQSAGV